MQREHSLRLSDADWRWLEHKGKLVLGTSAPDYSPFDITTSGKDYEGLTADVTGLLSDLFEIPIEVRSYRSRAEVIDALKSGEVDFLGSSNRFEAIDSALALSDSYAEDQPSLSTRVNDFDTLPSDLEGKRIAMLDHYLPADTVHAFYPGATLEVYPSSLSAMGAVAFGQADVYLGDTISANYLINNRYLNNVQLTDFSEMQAKHFSFALTRQNQRLLDIVNTALEAIPEEEHRRILTRWNAGDLSSSFKQHVFLDEPERQWIAQHPKLKVAFNETAMPLAFTDKNGEFRGISAEILAKIGFRTGLKFEAIAAGSTDDLVSMIKTGKADMLAAFVPTLEREQDLYFSRPYFVNPFVMLSRNTFSSPNTLDEMAGKKLAIQKGSALFNFIKRKYPSIQLIQVNSSMDAMAMLSEGKVDAAANSLINARYLIARHYRRQIKVTSTIGAWPAGASFATDHGARELQSILDKALLSIPPQELDKLTNRWRNEVLLEDTPWSKHKTKILQGLILVTLLLMATSIWITYLRRLIGKRKHAEQALSEQLSFMHEMLDGTPHPIYVRDNQGRLLNCNSTYLNVLGINKEDALGKTITASTAVDLEASLAYEKEYLEIILAGQPKSQDRKLVMQDGRELTIYHWMLPYRNSNDTVIGIIGGWIDISERQCLLDELQNAKNTADDANRAKTTFLASMSHEIRTPLNAVIGMLELAMKKAEHGVFDFPAIEVASDSAKGLLELIGDILDIARIESGKLSLTPEPTKLRNLVVSLMRVFEGLARQKGLRLKLQLDLKADREVLIDPLRFKQILSNLMSNAIKFTDEGDVRVNVVVFQTDNPGHMGLHVLVEDSGIGISLEDQQRLFRSFVQASNNPQSARTGSGLGLAISKTLCEMMGGELHLTSAVGRGTQVELFLELPFSQRQASCKPLPLETPSRATQALTVLVVDDNSANRMLMLKQLNYLGHQVLEAADGAQGLQAWQSNHVDVVITDCNMPVMNGFTLARTIRDEELAKHLPACRIFGFTANAQPGEKDKCLDAGMNDCLFKPIGLNNLQARLNCTVIPREQCPPPTLREKEGLVDLSGLRVITGANTAALNDLLTELTHIMSKDQDTLRALNKTGNLNALADLAHRIKGSATIIKSAPLINACQELYLACKAANTLSAQQHATHLDTLIANLLNDLKHYDLTD
ncbi:transporter substrate-binding domain-containing protein [Pseudomonas chlororaphis subsp. aurantiaca]|uniref:transporter substrate-binding domain-containing protein n=1 Tax=Pseudomonas chlororaphis TaxID=587753 RepID=UPI0027DE08E4|nr:transporter substrate-binding domain-containing protein [Pseudomonas chlororaphis]WMI97569.1 transporter substrate-binding domain-containing protein [Pseudomonas chlororaphis subsp. aurantiaca]